MPEVSIVIVNYNTKDHLFRCLTSLYRTQQRPAFDVIVVDNGSRDCSCEMLAAMFPQVVCIESGRNLGFSKGCNLGASHASGRYLLFLNSDTEVLPGALERLVTFCEGHPDVGIVTSRLVYPDFSDQGVARSFPTPMNALLGRQTLLTRCFPNNRFTRRYLLSRNHRAEDPFEVDWVSGACLLVRAEVFRDVGGFDEQFFMYWEDADLCFQVKRAGWRVFAVPSAIVVHHEGRSSKAKGRLIIEFHRSVYRYYRKNCLRFRFSPLHLCALTGLTARAGLLLIGHGVRQLIPTGPELSPRSGSVAAATEVAGPPFTTTV